MRRGQRRGCSMYLRLRSREGGRQVRQHSRESFRADGCETERQPAHDGTPRHTRPRRIIFILTSSSINNNSSNSSSSNNSNNQQQQPTTASEPRHADACVRVHVVLSSHVTSLGIHDLASVERRGVHPQNTHTSARVAVPQRVFERTRSPVLHDSNQASEHPRAWHAAASTPTTTAAAPLTEPQQSKLQ
jgi:hypothetical protein